MNKLKLSEWANIAEIFASVVLVLSLIYVGVELDQNTKAVHSDTWQAVVEKLVDLDIAEASSPELSSVVIRGESDPQNLTTEEWWRFKRLAQSRMGQLEHAYLAQTNDTLGESYWLALEGYLQYLACQKGYQTFWAENGQQLYHLNFFNYFSGKIANCSG